MHNTLSHVPAFESFTNMNCKRQGDLRPLKKNSKSTRRARLDILRHFPLTFNFSST